MSGGFEALLNALEVGEHNAIHQAERRQLFISDTVYQLTPNRHPNGNRI